ncbi:MAG: DUF1203 domain-containing protein [Litoreibacter sp.]|nr:DUF1203 domain-containing protein [Litoreibacter sp.]MCY4335062.1 DUF1203 domain-containing protein [Litoreibacter sp.]
MDFQIKPLNGDAFAYLFALDDAELAAQNACRQVVTETPGTPCRISMEDAEIGENVILFNYTHQPEGSPYQANHAVFMRENAKQAVPDINEVPEVIRRRLISLRYFDQDHMMIDADVVPGEQVEEQLSSAFDRDEIAYVHIHNAKPGCFAASAHRVA